MNTLSELLLIAFFSAAILWFGWKQGFFRWNPERDWNLSIRLLQVFAGFAIYFSISLFAPSIYASFLKDPFISTPEKFIGYATWLNFLLAGTIAAVLFFFWLTMKSPCKERIWRSPTAHQSYGKDLQMSFYAWCLSFPIVLFLNQALEKFLNAIGIDYIPDQVAVRFVKMTAEYPFYFSLALAAIVIFAPLIEEFLFRGLLQSFIRKHLGSKQAIFITALCFSFFHFSPEQGWGNLPIIGSLLPLALFLGFLYERQRSLFASIGMHSFFNLFSIVNLYFLGGIPCA